MGLFWPSPKRATRARLDCSRAAGSSIPTAKPGSTGSRTASPPRSSTTSTRCWLTTGRVVSQYLSGTQTRRIAALVAQYPEPLCEMHPKLAEPSASPTATS